MNYSDIYDYNKAGKPFHISLASPGSQHYETTSLIHTLFETQVLKTPDAPAVVETGGKKNTISYKALDKKAGQLAAALIKRGVKPGMPVGLIVDRSIDMVTAILGILKTGGAFLPINPANPNERTRYMLSDSNTRLLLTKRDLYKKLNLPVPRGVDVLFLDGDSLYDRNDRDAISLSQVKPAVLPGHPAYIIYTSGSTGNPKGVLITHGNLSPLLHWGHRTFRFTARDRVVKNLSYFFDWSVWEMFMALTAGAALYIPDENTIKNPAVFRQFIRLNRITVLHCTPTQFKAIITGAGANEPLDSLKYLCLGAEKLTPGLVRRSLEMVDQNCRVFNMYGPTEAAIMATMLEINRGREQDWGKYSSVPIGKAVGNIHLSVVDENLEPCPLNTPGQLLIGGDAVAPGYMNNPGLTAEKFMDAHGSWLETAGKKKTVSPMNHKPQDKNRFYKTGDIVRMLKNGDIEFIERVDDQVKIRGFRIELGEIEAHLVRHPSVNETVVVCRTGVNGEPYLCAYLVLRDKCDKSNKSIKRNKSDKKDKNDFDKTGIESLHLNQYLAGHLPEYMIPSVFMEIDMLPLSPTGKIDRKALPEPGEEAGAGSSKPVNHVEETIRELWARVLDIDCETIGTQNNFFALGGHSLTGSILALEIIRTFPVYFDQDDIFQFPTIKRQAQYISQYISSRMNAGNQNEEDYMAHTKSIIPVEKKDFYPLSPAQMRLYVTWTRNPGTAAYNIPWGVIIDGPVDKDRLEKTCKTLIRRHESLRTVFRTVNDTPVQVVLEADETGFPVEYFEIAHIDGSAGDIHREFKRFVRPFDLSRPPLLRVGLGSLADRKHVLFVDIHHIINDGVSVDIFRNEFSAFYAGEELPAPKLQYKDYAVAERVAHDPDQCAERKRAEEYWVNRFQGEIPKLELPLDYPRPAGPDQEGADASFYIDAQDTSRLHQLAKSENTTLFRLMLSIFTIFLSRLSGQEDIVVGIPSKGRHHPDLPGIFGMFVNTLAFRNYCRGDKTVKQFLDGVSKHAREALKSQSFQYEELVEKISPPREAGRNPLFDVMFSYQNTGNDQIRIPGASVTPVRPVKTSVKFDLVLICIEKDGGLFFSFEYRAKLFSPSTIQRFADFFKNTAAAVLENPEREIGSIGIISREEKQKILEEFNSTGQTFENQKTIHGLFQEQTRKTPDSPAIYFEGESLTYRELNTKANALARLLIQKGVAAGNFAGLMVKRSSQMIAGMLGVLKAGGAYLPLNPKNPAARTRFMLQDSGAKVLLTQHAVLEEGSNHYNAAIPANVETIYLDESANAFENIDNIPGHRIDTEPIVSRQNPWKDLAYVIYTSGSTGNPKGVLIEHRNLCPLLHWGYKELKLRESDRVLQNLSYFFDWSVWEIFLPLTSGSTLYIPREEVLLNPAAMARYMEENRITALHITPSQWQSFLSWEVEGSENTNHKRLKALTLNHLCIGAEKLNFDTVERSFAAVTDDCRVYNMYGPTEATIISTVLEIQRDYRNTYSHLNSIPIGGPVANINLFVLDPYFNICPVNIAGELYIGGGALARGYLNNAELTAEKFVATGGFFDTDGHRPKAQTFTDGFVLKDHLAPSTQHLALYKSGDLVRWLDSGDVEFLGRIDHQVKVRGYRIELTEIENRIKEYPFVREAVVITKPGRGADVFICAYVIARDRYDVEELRLMLAGVLPEYMIPSYFVEIETVPLTPNGKINLEALPEPVKGGDAEYTAPANETEKQLLELWLSVLEIEPDAAGSVGVTDNFFSLGGHSLKGMVLASRIHKTYNVKLALDDIFSCPTVRALAAFIETREQGQTGLVDGTGFEAIEAAGERPFYPLSSAQERLYYLQYKDENSAFYNIPWGVAWDGPMDVERLETVFRQLIERHESLRTSFHMEGDEPVQVIHPASEVEFSIARSHETVEETAARFVQPFDLSRVPLIRVEVAEAAGGQSYLFTDAHHIVIDGVSLDILKKEISALYSLKELPPLPLQYKDFSEWQNRRQGRDYLNRQEAFWLNRFSGDLPVLDLPIDFPRPPVQVFDGETVHFNFDTKLTRALNRLASGNNTTLFNVMLSCLYLFLMKLTRSEDVVIGIPTAGRDHSDTAGMVGMFVNTLALRNFPAGKKTVKEFLAEVSRHSLDAFKNQDYQFEDLVDRVCPVRDMARNPLFDTMFSFQDSGNTQIVVQGVNIEPYHFDSKIAKFDLTLICVKGDNRMDFELQYCVKLFTPQTIRRFVSLFTNAAREFAGHPDRELAEIAIKTTPSAKQGEEFWVEQFKDDIPLLELPADFARPHAITQHRGEHTFPLDAACTAPLNELARQEGTTLSSLVLSAFFVFLSRVSGQEDIVVGFPAAGRGHPDFTPITGDHVSALPLRNHPQGKKTFTGFLAEVSENATRAFHNRDFKLEELVEKVCKQPDAGRNPLFDVMFTYRDTGNSVTGLPGTTIAPCRYQNNSVKFDLNLTCIEQGGHLSFSMEYSAKLFTRKTIERFVSYFKNIVSAVLENPAVELGSIDIVTEEEKQTLLYKFNDPTPGCERENTFHNLFQRQVEQTPGHIALTFKDSALSYDELNIKAEGVAAALQERGIGTGHIVGVLSERSLEFLIGILGILKAGAAYLPMNPKNPVNRTIYMLKDTNAGVLLTQSSQNLKNNPELPENVEVLHLDDNEWYKNERRQCVKSTATWDDLAYVIYTSGSTGKPKGVPITHGNAMPLFDWSRRRIGLNKYDRVLQCLSYYFDWSIMEIFLTFTTGAQLVVPEDDTLHHPGTLFGFVDKRRVTWLFITPSHLHSSLNLWENPVKLDSLRCVLTGGEKLTYELATRTLALLNKDVKMVNCYGPTEATIVSSMLVVDHDSVNQYKDMASLPLGYLAGNTLTFVLDPQMNLCPVNVTGEIYIGGHCAARGYLNNPTLSSEKFMDISGIAGLRSASPGPHGQFSPFRPHYPQILYKTGDLGRWLPDGTIESLGRMDDQVKIRGYRIELGEIEDQLKQHHNVAGAVVLAHGEHAGNKELYAFVIAENDLIESDLYSFLNQLLPQYMIPAHFVFIDRIPVTGNGKIDKRKLFSLNDSKQEKKKTVEKPTTETEAFVLEIWKEILGRDEIGIYDNFFEIGGHSRKVTQMALEIHKQIKVRLGYRNIYQEPTIHKLGQLIDKRKSILI